jgi:LIVCS family branched-chain amino acid:cation transporter
VMVVAFMFGVLDGLKVAGFAMSGFDFLPLFEQGLAWVLPTALAIIVSIVAMRPQTNLNAAAAK